MLRLNMDCRNQRFQHLGERIYSAPPPKQDLTRWDTFTDEKAIQVMADAFGLLTRIASAEECNQFFRGLPGKRSLSEMVIGLGEKFWVSYDSAGTSAGETIGRHITIGRMPLRVGRWSVAATLLHELAHANGATDLDGQAERALIPCGLKAHYDASNAVRR